MLNILKDKLPFGAETVIDLLRGRYPNFVYGSDNLSGTVPVFGFHSVVPDEFEAILRFLSRNDYYTLTPQELTDWVLGKASLPQERVVLLTFDDGRGSVWSVAYPLLRRFNMRATVFLAPSFIEERDEYRPHLDDVHRGNASLETVLHRERGPQPFVTWEEISEMASSGALNFESHSYEHSLVFTSPKIVDFVRPELKAEFDVLELRISTTRGQPPTVETLPLGAPLYTTAPRLSGKARYFDDAELRRACAEYVAQRGGDSFFSRSDWRQELNSFVTSYREDNPFDDHYEDPEEIRESIRCDLAKSIEAIENRSGLDSVGYLAFPWAVGSELAVHEAQNLGLQGCFWEKTGNKYVNEQGQDPLYFRRMGADFLPLLPGEGRETLLSLFSKKVRRRLSTSTSSPYLTH